MSRKKTKKGISPRKEKEKTQTILIISSPKEYFSKKIRDVIKNQEIQVSYFVESYLANLLTSFLKMEDIAETYSLDNTPLTLLYCQTLKEGISEKQKILLKRMGDFSLFFTGYFSESFHRKTMDVETYIAIGKNSYAKLSSLLDSSLKQKLYMDLSQHFPLCVKLLSEISDSSKVTDNQGILNLYEKWLSSNDAYLHRMLDELDIVSKYNS